jgi:diguanylate cyclase (GGDEF)-like protein/PAS domain S-box-containing protein
VQQETATTDPPGPSGAELLDLTALRPVLVDRSPDVIVLVDFEGTIVYVSPAAELRTGWSPDQVIGWNIVDLIHHDDIERAVFDLALYTTGGAAPGYSSYRVKMADGTTARFDVSAADIELLPQRYLAFYCRLDDDASRSVLYGLLHGTSTADTLRPVCDVINWELHGSRVGIGWWEDDGYHTVGTGIPPALAGADPDTDADADTPWVRCRRKAATQRSTDVSTLDDTRRRLAHDLDLGAYWIEPVLDDEAEVCALITLWMRADGSVPELHMLGMSMAKDYVELIVRWTRQRRHLHDAARRDALTGLVNRTAFFESLASERGGAVLYCDLDQFKPVNDELGHIAGDELLHAVAGRIKASVRTGDLVARLGGDEFAVLCVDATRAQASELAERIRGALSEPFRISGTTARVSISIGVAHSSDHLGDDVLELADRALYRAKADGGSVVRWPDERP